MNIPMQTRPLESFLCGIWAAGSAPGERLVDPVTSEALATASSKGLDLAAATRHARDVGGLKLRAMSFAERGAVLGAIAEALQARRNDWFEISRRNSGNTKVDASIDVDGAIATLKYYSKLGASLGDARLLADGAAQRLGRDPNFQGRHIGTPLRGVAVHINAYNFPAWGLWGKAAVALLSGLPVLAKPATSTAWVAEEMVRAVNQAGVLPPGVLSLLCGSAADLLDQLRFGDAVAFTGSAETGARIRAALAGKGVRLNIEADSLNATLLGPDAHPGSAAFGLLAAEVAREMTIKAGQKCTAIRRILVPSVHASTLGEAIAERLSQVVIGDPAHAEVGMGPVVSHGQRNSVEEGLAQLSGRTKRLTPERPPLRGGDWKTGAFVAPALLRAEPGNALVHELEVFGPAATLVPYANAADAFELARRGGGSLAASVFSQDPDFLAEAAVELGQAHGRLLLIDPSIGESHSGHGIVLPSCLHGGPGRAGDGAELGGLRGLWFYHQRSAVQAAGPTLERLAGRLADAAGL
jgi:3,4-dehydroadipyl-CoA semialdehyde dehydrogenase